MAEIREKASPGTTARRLGKGADGPLRLPVDRSNRRPSWSISQVLKLAMLGRAESKMESAAMMLRTRSGF